MIEMYTGTPGSGKSLHCAKTIYRKLLSGRNVIANFDINLSVFKPKQQGRLGAFVWKDNSELTPGYFYMYAMAHHRRNRQGRIVEGQTLVIFDECQIMFNAREYSRKDRMEWCTFFTQHRKYGYDIILITQFDRMVDRQIRALVEYQIVHRKVSNFKTLDFVLGLFAGGHLFVAVTMWYGMHEKIDHEFFRLRKRYMRMYDSYKIFHVDTGGDTGAPAGGRGGEVEAGVQPPRPVWKAGNVG